MKRCYLIIIVLLTAGQLTFGQDKKKKSRVTINKQNRENNKFLEKQWWLGIKGGVNLAKVNVEKVYNIVAPTNYEISTIEKKYKSFKQMGSQVAFEATFNFRNLSLSFQPTYQHSRFIYTNSYTWTDSEDAANQLVMNYEQEQSIDHLILPLIVKYEITGNKLRPYVQAGIYSALLLSANKSVTIEGTDYAAGGKNEFSDEPIIVGARDLFAKSHWGLMGGIGTYYNVGNVRFNLDVQYKYGMSNITSVSNRYSNDRLSGVGEAMDDLTLDNLSFSLGCLFPLRFLESSFKSSDRK